MPNIRKPVCTLLALLAFTFALSCSNMVQVKIDVVDQRTALENQVLGTYQQIGDDLNMLASVRSIDSAGRLVQPPPISEGRKKALKAMRRSEFNKDDIESFKTDGALGESNSGYLVFFKTEKTTADPKIEKFIRNLVSEENEDRKVLYQRIVDINENFREGDMPKVEAIMAGLNRDSAAQGEMIQLDSGKWTKKPKG